MQNKFFPKFFKTTKLMNLWKCQQLLRKYKVFFFGTIIINVLSGGFFFLVCRLLILPSFAVDFFAPEKKLVTMIINFLLSKLWKWGLFYKFLFTFFIFKQWTYLWDNIHLFVKFVFLGVLYSFICLSIKKVCI